MQSDLHVENWEPMAVGSQYCCCVSGVLGKFDLQYLCNIEMKHKSLHLVHLVPGVTFAKSKNRRQRERLSRVFVCVCSSTVTVICGSLRQSGWSAVVSQFSGWLPYITESLMSPDSVRVMFWGSQRQVHSPPCWAETNMSRGSYAVIKKKRLLATCKLFQHVEEDHVTVQVCWCSMIFKICKMSQGLIGLVFIGNSVLYITMQYIFCYTGNRVN